MLGTLRPKIGDPRVESKVRVIWGVRVPLPFFRCLVFRVGELMLVQACYPSSWELNCSQIKIQSEPPTPSLQCQCPRSTYPPPFPPSSLLRLTYNTNQIDTLRIFNLIHTPVVPAHAHRFTSYAHMTCSYRSVCAPIFQLWFTYQKQYQLSFQDDTSRAMSISQTLFEHQIGRHVRCMFDVASATSGPNKCNDVNVARRDSVEKLTSTFICYTLTPQQPFSASLTPPVFHHCLNML